LVTYTMADLKLSMTMDLTTHEKRRVIGKMCVCLKQTGAKTTRTAVTKTQWMKWIGQQHGMQRTACLQAQSPSACYELMPSHL